MTLRQLEMLSALVECGAYAKAAEQLHVSHSAIHRQVRLLGEELNDRLVYRARKRLHLTDGGKICVDLARRICVDLSRAKRQVIESNQMQSGQLRIGTGPTLLCRFLPRILQGFLQKFPRVELYIMGGPTEQVLEQLCKDRLDVAILFTPLDLPKSELRLKCEPIYRDEYVLALGKQHPLCTRANNKLTFIESLRELHFIMPPRIKVAPLRAMLDRRLQDVGVIPKVIMEIDNQEAMERMVELNMGFAFLSKLWAAERQIQCFSFPGQPIYRDVVLVYPEADYIPPALTAFRQFCSRHTPGGDPKTRRGKSPQNRLTMNHRPAR